MEVSGREKVMVSALEEAKNSVDPYIKSIWQVIQFEKRCRNKDYDPWCYTQLAYLMQSEDFPALHCLKDLSKGYSTPMPSRKVLSLTKSKSDQHPNSRRSCPYSEEFKNLLLNARLDVAYESMFTTLDKAVRHSISEPKDRKAFTDKIEPLMLSISHLIAFSGESFREYLGHFIKNKRLVDAVNDRWEGVEMNFPLRF